MREWISPNTGLTAEKDCLCQRFTFQIQTISLNFLSFRFLLNLHQHATCASSCFYLYECLSLFASLSQLFLTLVTQAVVMCFYPFQAPMPSTGLFRSLSCCPCVIIFCLMLHCAPLAVSKPILSCLHSQCLWTCSCRMFHLHVSPLLPAGQESVLQGCLVPTNRHNLIMSCTDVWDLPFSVVCMGILHL